MKPEIEAFRGPAAMLMHMRAIRQGPIADCPRRPLVTLGNECK